MTDIGAALLNSQIEDPHRPFFDPRMALYDASGFKDPQSKLYGNEIEYKNFDSQSTKKYLSLKQATAAGTSLRQQINFAAIFLAVAVPFVCFFSTFQAMSFTLYDHHPGLAALVIFGFVFAMLCVGACATQAKRETLVGGKGTWHLFIFCTGLLAIFLGTFLGYCNREWNSKWYYQYINLRKLVDVDPGAWSGKQMLDAGEIDIRKGTTINTKLFSFYQHQDAYCVAPLVSGDGYNMVHYDMWAVGKNCCSSMTGEFMCHLDQATAGLPTGGLRVIDPAEVAHYRLAVEQAAAQHKIGFHNPIFLHMELHPFQTIKAYMDEAKEFSAISAIAYLVMQCCLVGFQAVAFGVNKPSGFRDPTDPENNPVHHPGMALFNPQHHH